MQMCHFTCKHQGQTAACSVLLSIQRCKVMEQPRLEPGLPRRALYSLLGLVLESVLVPPWCSPSRTVHIQAWDCLAGLWRCYFSMEQKAMSNPVASFQDSTRNLGVEHKRTRCFKVCQVCFAEKNVGRSTEYVKQREKIKRGLIVVVANLHKKANFR